MGKGLILRAGGGIDLSPVTAGANDVLVGKVIVDKNGNPITGRIQKQEAMVVTPGTTDTVVNVNEKYMTGNIIVRGVQPQMMIRPCDWDNAVAEQYHYIGVSGIGFLPGEALIYATVVDVDTYDTYLISFYLSGNSYDSSNEDNCHAEFDGYTAALWSTGVEPLTLTLSFTGGWFIVTQFEFYEVNRDGVPY